VFSITSEQRQYTTYLLQDEQAAARLEVVPERGGIITRWAIGDAEVLYLDGDRFADPTLSVRGGIPILFPICGNLPDNTYTHDGQSYALKQHGFARNLPWAIAHQSTDTAASLTLQLDSNDTTRQQYPFDFRLQFTYRLLGNGLEIHQRVENQSAEPLPFSLGLHPYFNVSDKAALQFSIPATEVRSQIDHSLSPFAGQFDLSQPELDLLFADLSAASASVVDPTQGIRLDLTYSDAYSMLVFWTLHDKDFYCLEPWTAGRNALNTGDRLLHLPPHETQTTTVRLTVSPLS